LDRDKIEKENYDNSIFPKNYVGKTKVIALSSLVQLISSLQTTPIHQDVKSSEQLADICFNYDIGFIFATFDNIKSRLIVREVALSLGIPTIFIGVTEGYVYIDWADKIVLPETLEEMLNVEQEVKRIRDVCTRLEFRHLGVIAAGYAYYSFIKWVNKKEKNMYNISVRDQITSTTLKRI
jgi:molybdopterin/thiamine biosynthesis adenylyltransferase